MTPTRLERAKQVCRLIEELKSVAMDTLIMQDAPPGDDFALILWLTRKLKYESRPEPVENSEYL